MKYVCELCGTCYDEQLGDPQHGIPAGTAFASLPAQYECPCCGSEREAFSPADGQIRTAAKDTEGDNCFWQYAKYTEDHHSSER